MKAWLTVFSAVIAAGLVLFAIIAAISEISARRERAAAAWSQAHALFEKAADFELTGPGEITKQSIDRTRQLRSQGDHLKATAPNEAYLTQLSQTLRRLEIHELYLQSIDWKKVDEWDAKVAAVMDHLRRVMDDHTLTIDVKKYEVRFVQSRLMDLVDSRPDGSNLQRWQENVSELARANQKLIQ